MHHVFEQHVTLLENLAGACAVAWKTSAGECQPHALEPRECQLEHGPRCGTSCAGMENASWRMLCGLQNVDWSRQCELEHRAGVSWMRDLARYHGEYELAHTHGECHLVPALWPGERDVSW
jgi:hypothetical protein